MRRITTETGAPTVVGPDLAELFKLWPKLPKPTREAIWTLTRTKCQDPTD